MRKYAKGFTFPNIFLFFYLFFVFVACTPSKKDTNHGKIVGTWYANEANLYHTLYFQDSLHLALDTHIDTTFFYEYHFIGDSALAICKKYAQVISRHKILKLDQDSLVLQGLLDRGDTLRYGKARKFSHKK